MYVLAIGVGMVICETPLCGKPLQGKTLISNHTTLYFIIILILKYCIVQTSARF